MITNQTLFRHFASILLLCGGVVAVAANETESNNDQGSADEIVVGSSHNGKIASATDIDWFKLTGTQAGHSYKIEATNVGRDLDIALELFTFDGKALGSSNGGLEGENENIPFEATSAGDYLVRVRQTGFWGVNISYTLTFADITKPKVAGSITLLTDTNSPTGVVAGTTPTTVEFQLLNSEGKAAGMGDKPVTFTLTGPTGWIAPSLSTSIKTGADGKFTFDWKDASGAAILFTKVGEYTLAVATEGKNKSVTLTFIPADPAKLTWAGTGIQSTGVPTYIAQNLTFKVFDQYDNPVTARQTIEVQITKPDGATATLEPPSPLTTDANGQVNVVFTPDQAVEYTIKTLSSSTEVMKVISSLPTLVGEATDGQSPITFTLTHNGNGIGQQSIDVSLQQPTDGKASLEPTSGFTTDKDGKVAVSLKDATVPGEYTVFAKLSVPNSKIKDSTGAEQEKIEVKVSVAATAPDSLTVKGGETQTISSDTVSVQITFELKAGENPIEKTLEVKLSKEPDKHKACLVSADNAVCDANNLVTTLQVTTDATSGEGKVWLKEAKLVGEYTITATLQDSKSPLTKQVKVTVNAGAPTNLTVGTDKLFRQVQHLTLAEASKAREIVFNLTDKDGNAVAGQVNFKIEPAPAEASTPPAEASTPVVDTVVCLGIDANKPCTEDRVTTAPVDAKTGQVKVFLKGLDMVGQYTVKATWGSNPELTAEMVVEVGNLAVTVGGNQILLKKTGDDNITITMPLSITVELRDGIGSDQIVTEKDVFGQLVSGSDKEPEIVLILEKLSGTPIGDGEKLLGVETDGKTPTDLSNPTKPLPVQPGKENQTKRFATTLNKGKVEIKFTAPATIVSDTEPVAAYKITANVNALEDYTEVFVVAKKVGELVGEGEGKIWPSLDQGEKLKRQATECEGWAWNASGTPVKTEATFYGGLKKETDTGAFQIKIDDAGGVKSKQIDNGNFVEGTGDPVVVQGVIKVDPQDKKEVAGLFVLGENEFPEGFNPAKGLYMLGRPFGDIRPLKDDTKMLIAFRRNVTPDQDDYILLEMYREAFYYPGTLKVFFGYYTKDGTIVHNCTPIEVKITQ